MKLTDKTIISGLLGVSVGDALGVPVEFQSRNILQTNPVTDMIGYGTHDQAPGTWSDDSSLTFCLAESLCYGYNPADAAKKMVKWFYEAYWTAHGSVFDIGISTQESIARLREGVSFQASGNKQVNSNGNGSLMRILPLAFYFTVKEHDVAQRFKKCEEISSITHAHIRSAIACFIYVEFAMQLISGKTKTEAYQFVRTQSLSDLTKIGISQKELDHFYRIFTIDISQLPENEIESSGYVVHTLEASIWVLINNSNYPNTVLNAVNLGSDTDTTGAVAGGLAGLVYGKEDIPDTWTEKIARKEDIINLAQRLFLSLYN